MSATTTRALLFSLGLALMTSVPARAFAEQVECPGCWRMIDEGPCRCPHCENELPGRTCSPDEDRPRHSKRNAREQQPPSASSTRPAAARDSEAKRRPRRRRRPSKGSRTERGDAPSREEAERPRRRRRPSSEARPPSKRPRRSESDESSSSSRRPQEEFNEEGEGSDEPRARRRPPRRRRPPPDDEDDLAVIEEEQEEAEDDARSSEEYRIGPYFLLGYRYWGLKDWVGDGHTHALSIEGFPIARFVPWLRVGIGLDIAFRITDPHTDWVMRGFATLGIQYPRRVTPYLALSVGGGSMFQKRFGQATIHGLFATNIEGGATFKLTRTFVADLSLGYMFTMSNNLGFHSVTLRIGFGW